MGTIVNKTIQEATARLKENYEAQKIFDMSLGDCVPNRDAIISIIEGLRTVTFPGFFGSENMAYVSKDNFAGSTLAILYERLFKQVRVALKFDNKELADADQRIMSSFKLP
jgi:serine O-acetyltransferase